MSQTDIKKIDAVLNERDKRPEPERPTMMIYIEREYEENLQWLEDYHDIVDFLLE